jgi:hypothetical protein
LSYRRTVAISGLTAGIVIIIFASFRPQFAAVMLTAGSNLSIASLSWYFGGRLTKDTRPSEPTDKQKPTQ